MSTARREASAVPQQRDATLAIHSANSSVRAATKLSDVRGRRLASEQGAKVEATAPQSFFFDSKPVCSVSNTEAHKRRRAREVHCVVAKRVVDECVGNGVCVGCSAACWR